MIPRASASGWRSRPPPPGNADRPLRIDFGAAHWGYGWDFPKSGSSTIGIGGVLSRNEDMKGAMAAYLDLLGQDPTQPVKGHHLPFGDFRRRPGRGAVLLAGDAAGLVDPITGEGIAYALKSGQLAAQAAVQALAEDAPRRPCAATARPCARSTGRSARRGPSACCSSRRSSARPSSRPSVDPGTCAISTCGCWQERSNIPTWRVPRCGACPLSSPAPCSEAEQSRRLRETLDLSPESAKDFRATDQR